MAGTGRRAWKRLAWAYQLPQLAAWLPAPLWWRLLARLVAIAGGRRNRPGSPAAGQSTLGRRIAAGAGRINFPSSILATSWPRPAARLWPRGIAELLDGEGLPQCRRLAIFRPLLRLLDPGRTHRRQIDLGFGAEKQFVHALREAVRLSRADGRQVLPSGSAEAWSAKMLKQALRLVDSGRLARRAARCCRRPAAWPATVARPDVAAAVHGDWAELAVLQPGWQSRRTETDRWPTATRSARVELEAGRRDPLVGRWQFELQADGRPLTIDSHWEEVCWVSDEDADYVEIEAQLTDGFRLQRQISARARIECCWPPMP